MTAQEITYDALQKRLAKTEAENARLRDALKWRGAINHALTNWLSPIEDHETPADALRRLIRLEVDAALDPAVSQSAADLVAKAKRDALDKAARAMKPMLRSMISRVEAFNIIRALKGEGNE